MTLPLSKAAVEAAARAQLALDMCAGHRGWVAWPGVPHHEQEIRLGNAAAVLRAAIEVYVPNEAQREAAYLAGDNNESGAILAAIRTETDE